MRRVAIQLTSTGGFYGAERSLVEIAAFLASRGWESHVIALEGKGTSELLRRAAECGVKATSYANGTRMSALGLVAKLRRTLSAIPQAVVHSHGYKPDILLASLGIPRRLCCLATCHTWYSDTLKMKLTERLDKRVLRSFDHVVAVSDDIRADLLASGLTESRVSKIDNGISVPSLEPDVRLRIREELGIRPDELVIVQVGRLARSKRNDLLLSTVARLPEALRVTVLLVGEGEQRPALVEQVRALGITDRVVFCGYRTDVPRILAGADVLALTSNKEGLPIILLEAMAIGCPIVSTAVGAVPAVLKDKLSACVVPIDDAEALYRAIEESLTNRPLAKQRAGRARQDFLAGYSREAMGERYLSIYESVWRARGWR